MNILPEVVGVETDTIVDGGDGCPEIEDDDGFEP